MIKLIFQILLVFVTVTCLSLTFIVKYHVKSILEEVVLSETKKKYKLDLSKVSIDLTKGKVIVKDANLEPSNPSRCETYYQLKITDLYFTLASWKQLLFHHTLFVDSLRINRANISIFHSSARRNTNAAFHIGEIYVSLKSISEEFKVHRLEMNDIGISIYQEANSTPLLISHINFRVENFGQKKKEESKLRYSDDIVLNIPRQHWIFPSGHSLSFKNLFFSGKDQFFLLDSCTLIIGKDNTSHSSSLFAEKLSFRADRLSSIFESNELNIDTLYCKSPVLSFTMPGKLPEKDSVNGLHQLLGNIHIKYTSIENGEIQLNSADGNRSYSGKKTNLTIYALNIDRDQFPHIRAGNIDLRLNSVSFASRDSLYLLTIKDFELNGKNLVCRNAFLKPSSNNYGSLSGISFPAFTFIDVSLQDLLEKRLKARTVLVEAPRIYLTAGAKNKKIPGHDAPINRFYDALNELSQMIDVHRLIVTHGELEYYSELDKDFKLSIIDFNTEINLDDLLKSSSPLATKQSIRAMSIGLFSLTTANTKIELKNFFINGTRQTGIIMSSHLELPSGIHLSGDNIYWEKFSWGDFLKDKRIDMDSLDIGGLYFTAGNQPQNSWDKKGAIPDVNIKKLNIRSAFIDISKGKNNAELRAKANNVLVTKLTMVNNLLSWADVDAKLEDISFHDNIKRVAIHQITFSDNGESRADNIVYNDATNLLRIHQIKFKLDIHSPNFRRVDFPYLSIYRPEIIIKKSAVNALTLKKNTVTSVIPFHVQKLDITDGRFNYEYPGKQITASANFGVKIESAHKDSDDAILFDKGVFHFSSILVRTENLPITLDNLNLNIRMGSLWGINQSQPVLLGFLNGQWDSLTLKRQTKNNFFEVSDLSGKVEDFPLSLGANSNIEDIISNMSLRKGRLFYGDSAVTASIANISSAGKEGVIELKGIEIKPKATWQSFLKMSAWQKSYLTFNCDRIVLNKINSHTLLQDRALNIQHVSLQNPRLSTYRDMNIAFQHGIEKLMPTKLISGIRIPVHIDSVSVEGASIDVQEVSAITKREGIIPVRNLDALFMNIKSQPDQKDSLLIEASGKVADYTIRKFVYSESYHDSLSGFKMGYNVSPMSLPAFTKVTNPLSAVAITSGSADTLYTTVSGNKYAAFGEMNFYYDRFKIRFLNKEDTLKENFPLAFKTLVANSFVIKSSNKKQSCMFFIRDGERFVFNYWVKTLFSGFLTSTGVKRNSRYKKMHNHLKEKYSLPAITN